MLCSHVPLSRWCTTHHYPLCVMHIMWAKCIATTWNSLAISFWISVSISSPPLLYTLFRPYSSFILLSLAQVYTGVESSLACQPLHPPQRWRGWQARLVASSSAVLKTPLCGWESANWLGRCPYRRLPGLYPPKGCQCWAAKHLRLWYVNEWWSQRMTRGTLTGECELCCWVRTEANLGTLWE